MPENIFVIERMKKVITEARKQGISDENIKEYLKLTKSFEGEEGEIMKEILKDEDIYLSEFAPYSSQLDELMKETAENVLENQSSTELSEKSKKLLEKIDGLTQKIEQEKSPLKRHMLSFKIKMLISKIQREIDLQNLKDSYQEKRDTLKREKDERDTEGLDNIAELNDRVLLLKREINGNEEYDAESEYFMYPQKYVQEIGGVENLTSKLKQSQKVESQQAAKRIEFVAQKRQELEELEDKLVQEKESLENSTKQYNKENRKNNITEKAMIAKQKANIFSRIGFFFTNMMEEVKAYREERKQNKELDVKLKEEEKALEEEYKKRIEELKEEQRKAKEQLKEEQNKLKDEQQQQQATDKASEFRTKMAEIGKEEPQEQENNSEPTEQQEEQTQDENEQSGEEPEV